MAHAPSEWLPAPRRCANTVGEPAVVLPERVWCPSRPISARSVAQQRCKTAGFAYRTSVILGDPRHRHDRGLPESPAVDNGASPEVACPPCLRQAGGRASRVGSVADLTRLLASYVCFSTLNCLLAPVLSLAGPHDFVAYRTNLVDYETISR
jgi:hypothetical protein